MPIIVSSCQWRSEGNWRPGANLNFGPPPLKKKKILKIDDVSSIQLIMCIYRRSLHVYFTTFDMILKYILTKSHTCKISPPIIPINPVKQCTKFKMRDMFL